MRAKCMRCDRLHPRYDMGKKTIYLLWCENCGTQMHEPTMEFYYKNRLNGANWYKPGYGLSINEGGRGPVFTWLFGRMVYICLWLSPKLQWRFRWIKS